MGRNKISTPEQINQVIELSKNYTRKEISEKTGLTKFAIQYIQDKNNIEPKFRNSLVRMEPEGEYFDIDKYYRKYIC